MYVTYNYIWTKEGVNEGQNNTIYRNLDLLDDIQSLINILVRKIQYQYDLTPQNYGF